MYKAEVITSWSGTGTQVDPNHPTIADDHAVGMWQDVTGQPSTNLQPDPNIYVLYIECELAILNAIEADANYDVIWSEEIIDGP